MRARAVELVEKELDETQDGIKSILLSSITDAYQPLERELELARTILEILTEHRKPYLIATKSDLVLRDLDLISKGQGVVQFSITCEPGYQAKEFWEPYSSSIEQRIEAVKTFHENGIPTVVNVCPILPLSNPIEIIDLLWDEVDWWVFDKLNDYKIDNKWYIQTKKRIIKHAESFGLQYTIKRGY